MPHPTTGPEPLPHCRIQYDADSPVGAALCVVTEHGVKYQLDGVSDLTLRAGPEALSRLEVEVALERLSFSGASNPRIL